MKRFLGTILTTVWKKQKGARWKVVLDMGNSCPEPKDNGSR
jgi:hypothetical protein